ncbi:protocatechuate 3,4-dioxygenase [Motiliproteus coralliicola]|uniref:Protocatechuate 3,4-dioxygenase n=1 Tax=Motiliproteus coralliicola TaxID=2283196 RepID=A0A369WAC6_9GAMM|nr:protocatechuate 3,4-dioxygenase [Motiliproteus coralliicola]RDE18960.1 protocatechuate 3,4-dioxygenase [Motiliproteus coralliicola]
MKPLSRRKLLIDSAAIAGGSALSGTVIAAILTPSASEGPFYPTASMRMDDVDNDLVKVAGAVEQAGGEIIELHGRLLNRQGLPLADHRVEIWQCDVNGKYLHRGDDRNVVYDTGFQGFGHDITDADGHYRFRTIKPTIYPGRAPHIHVKVLKGRHELLTTQFYIADDPHNRRDWLYRRMSRAEAESVSMRFAEAGNLLETQVDIIV